MEEKKEQGQEFSRLHQLFESSPDFQALTPKERYTASQQIYDELAKRPDVTSMRLRQFRDDQERMLYDYDRTKSGLDLPFEAWKQVRSNTGELANAPEIKRPENFYDEADFYKEVFANNSKESAKDFLNILGHDPLYPVKSGVKSLQDLGVMGIAALKAVQGSTSAGLKNLLGRSILPLSYKPDNTSFSNLFAQEMRNWQVAQASEDWRKKGLYNIITNPLTALTDMAYKPSYRYLNSFAEQSEAVKQDPEMAHLWDWGVMTAMFGGMSGLSAVKAGAQIAGGLQAVSLADKVRLFSAPFIGQMATDMSLYQGMKGVEKIIQNSSMDDDTKFTLSMFAMMAGGHGIGLGVSRLATSKYLEGVALNLRANRTMEGKPGGKGSVEEIENLVEEPLEDSLSMEEILGMEKPKEEQKPVETLQFGSISPETASNIDLLIRTNPELEPLIAETANEMGIPLERANFALSEEGRELGAAISGKDKIFSGEEIGPEESQALQNYGPDPSKQELGLSEPLGLPQGRQRRPMPVVEESGEPIELGPALTEEEVRALDAEAFPENREEVRPFEEPIEEPIETEAASQEGTPEPKEATQEAPTKVVPQEPITQGPVRDRAKYEQERDVTTGMEAYNFELPKDEVKERELALRGLTEKALGAPKWDATWEDLFRQALEAKKITGLNIYKNDFWKWYDRTARNIAGWMKQHYGEASVENAVSHGIMNGEATSKVPYGVQKANHLVNQIVEIENAAREIQKSFAPNNVSTVAQKLIMARLHLLRWLVAARAANAGLPLPELARLTQGTRAGGPVGRLALDLGRRYPSRFFLADGIEGAKKNGLFRSDVSNIAEAIEDLTKSINGFMKYIHRDNHYSLRSDASAAFGEGIEGGFMDGIRFDKTNYKQIPKEFQGTKNPFDPSTQMLTPFTVRTEESVKRAYDQLAAFESSPASYTGPERPVGKKRFYRGKGKGKAKKEKVPTEQKPEVVEQEAIGQEEATALPEPNADPGMRAKKNLYSLKEYANMAKDAYKRGDKELVDGYVGIIRDLQKDSAIRIAGAEKLEKLINGRIEEARKELSSAYSQFLEQQKGATPEMRKTLEGQWEYLEADLRGRLEELETNKDMLKTLRTGKFVQRLNREKIRKAADKSIQALKAARKQAIEESSRIRQVQEENELAQKLLEQRRLEAEEKIRQTNEAIREQERAKAEAALKTPVKSAGITLTNVQSRLAALPDELQLRIAQIVNMVNLGKQSMLGGKSLTKKQRLETLKEVLETPDAWNDKVFSKVEQKDEPVTSWGDLQARYIEDNYPELCSVMKVMEPDSLSKNTFSPDTLLRLMRTGTEMAGPSMDGQAWATTKETLAQAFDLWDSVKGTLGQQIESGGLPLKEYMLQRSKDLGLTKKAANKLAESFEEVFPSSALTFSFDSPGEGAIASYYALGRFVKAGDVKNLDHLIHEMGHDFFLYEMDSQAKMDYLEMCRNMAAIPGEWGKNFPGYTEMEAKLAKEKVTKKELLKANLWLNSPLEMFSQQFAALIGQNRLPAVTALQSFTKLKNKMAHILGMNGSAFDQMGSDAKKMIIKLTALPGEDKIVEKPQQVLDERYMQNVWSPKGDIQEAMVRIEEIESRLNSTYESAGVSLDAMSLEGDTRFADMALQQGREFAEAPGMQEIQLFTEIPPEQAIPMLDVLDISDYIHMQAMKIEFDLPGASLEGMRMASRRMEQLLMPNKFGSYLNERMKAETGRDTMGELGIGEDLASDIAYDNYQREMRELEMEPDLAETDLAQSSVNLEAQAMRQTYEGIKEYANLVMAKKGLADIIDGAYRDLQGEALDFIKIGDWENASTPKEWVRDFLVTGLRGAYTFYAGLEPDPNGFYVPLLGHVKWSPNKILTNPIALALMPWSRQIARGAKLGFLKGHDKIVGKLPQGVAEAITKTEDSVKNTLKWLLAERGTTDKNLSEVLGGAERRVHHEIADITAFAEFLQTNYTPKELRTMSHFYDFRDITPKMLAGIEKSRRADIMLGVSMMRKIVDQAGNELFRLSGGKLVLPKYYKKAEEQRRIAVFNLDNISAIKMNTLKGQNFTITVGGAQNYTTLMGSAKNAGIEIKIGSQLNGYKDYTGKLVLAAPGTMLDMVYKAKYLPEAVWGKSDKLQGYTVTNLGKRSVRITRPFNARENIIKGSVEEASIRMAYLAETLQRDLLRANIFDEILQSSYAFSPHKKNGPYASFAEAEAFAKDNPDYRYVPVLADKDTGALKYGTLSGAYIHTEAWNALQAMEGLSFMSLAKITNPQLHSAVQAYKTGLKWWKKSKTVWNIVSHVNNFVSNVVMGQLLGHNVARELYYGVQFVGLGRKNRLKREAMKKGNLLEANRLQAEMETHPLYADFQELSRMGIESTTMYSSELQTETLLKSLERINSGQGPDKPGIVRIVLDALRSVDGAAGRIYEAGDLLFKMGSYKVGKLQGMRTEEALRHAYEAYFDYGQVNVVNKFARDTGIVPFATYIAKAVPALVRGIKDKPENFVIALMLLEGIHMAGVASAYGTDELLQKAEDLEMTMPEHLRKKGWFGGLRTSIALPGMSRMDEEYEGAGRVRMAKLTRMIPLGDMREALTQEVDGNPFMGVSLARSILSSNPITQLAMMAVSGSDIGMNTPIGLEGVHLADPYVSGQFWKDYAKRALNTLLPNLPITMLHHGLGSYSYDNMMNGLVGAGILPEGFDGFTGTDALGVAQPLASMLANQVGLKNYEFDPAYTVEKNYKYTTSQINKAKGVMNSRLSDVNARSLPQDDDKKIEAFEEFEERQMDILDKRDDALERLIKARRTKTGGTALPK